MKILSYFNSKVKYALSALIMTLPLLTAAQTPAASDIWIGKLNLWEKQAISDLVRITDTEAYSNQPYFFNNKQLYFTEMISTEEVKQTDIMLFDVNSGITKNITESVESEYSPTPVPAKNNLSVIRVNEQGKQELWEISPQGKPINHLVPDIEPVGYQVWVNKEELLLFVLGEPNRLQRVNTTLQTQQISTIDTDIGATLLRFQQSNWFLYSVSADGGYWLNAYNAKTGKVKQVMALDEGSQYFTLSPTGDLLTSDGQQIKHSRLIIKGDKIKAMGKARAIKLDHEYCSSNVSRMAISPNSTMIALVCPTNKRPMNTQ